MGIQTDDFSFGAIDTKTTLRSDTGEKTGEIQYERKIFGLEDYRMSFATAGLVLETEFEIRTGYYVKEKIDSGGKKKSYSDVINEISDLYKQAYEDQGTYEHESYLMIFGSNPNTLKPFLYKCSSPNFEPEAIKQNELFFIGAYSDQYKAKATEIFNELMLECSSDGYDFNLMEWATKTFDAMSHNDAVGYPYILHLYKPYLALFTDERAQYTGDTISKGEYRIRTDFDVELTHIK